MRWQWHQLDYMQIICTLLQTDNHISTSPLSFYRPDAVSATQPTASKHWRKFVNIKLVINLLKGLTVCYVAIIVLYCIVSGIWLSCQHVWWFWRLNSVVDGGCCWWFLGQRPLDIFTDSTFLFWLRNWLSLMTVFLRDISFKLTLFIGCLTLWTYYRTVAGCICSENVRKSAAVGWAH